MYGCKVAATKSRKVAATKSCKIAATKSRKVAATKSRKVAATKSSKTNLHTKNSQGATMPQLAAATKPHHCCLFAAIHCEKLFISIRAEVIDGLSNKKKKMTILQTSALNNSIKNDSAQSKLDLGCMSNFSRE